MVGDVVLTGSKATGPKSGAGEPGPISGQDLGQIELRAVCNVGSCPKMKLSIVQQSGSQITFVAMSSPGAKMDTFGEEYQHFS